jgi:hypothetical protein
MRFFILLKKGGFVLVLSIVFGVSDCVLTNCGFLVRSVLITDFQVLHSISTFRILRVVGVVVSVVMTRRHLSDYLTKTEATFFLSDTLLILIVFRVVWELNCANYACVRVAQQLVGGHSSPVRVRKFPACLCDLRFVLFRSF